ncbi:hypothetical protein D9758_009577 [Tetrapyrgos nigripes]|uniref:Uncharacterized protein n=1 Tax=Tetrapyrgos nigripes TaxID=182062 RepID=A0A8H5LM66_9AGAR|nr:hypothetical protein D9758_009577 [Tetrapyrgos nigripes]
MSEGIQITIPDFDDEDYGSSAIPFGRSAGNAFGFGAGGGFGGGGFGSGGLGNTTPFGAALNAVPDSPTLMTPIALDKSDKGYFGSHNRGDSITSLESTGSNSAASRYLNKSTTSFTQSTHSGSSQSTGFTKKTSFASIRNAFKSGKNNEPPPVPQLENYVMKNAFNRSTSSLSNNGPPIPSRGPFGGSIATSPPFGRPPTPGSGDSKYARTPKRGHSYAKSQHSQSGSIYHYSDTGSDGHGNQFSTSPPPVPRVPNSFGEALRSETPDYEEDKVVMDPKTPSDFALHAVFMRFASTAEAKIDSFLRQPLESDPLLPGFIGPGTDQKFDEVLRSLGQIAQKHTKPVLDSIMRWRRSQVENVGSDLIEYHRTMPDTNVNRSIRPSEVPGLLNARKALAAIYIMCRALIAVVQTLSKDAIGENLGYSLEKTTFDQFRKPDLKLLMQSANHRTNADLSAELLGHLANIRFVSVTDRFLAELAPVAQGQVPKDLDMKYENLVQGIKYIQIKVWPSEAFEDGAEFMEQLSKAFANAHGFRLKTTFAETLIQILHPIGQTAQAETNIPLWAKAIELIHPKAREMAAKPRYWSVAFPLVITSLCVAPEAYFRKHWVPCFEVSLSKMKEKSLRVPILHGLTRLLWTYLYRCQESASTTTTKLDSLLRYIFPPNRISIYPPEEYIEPFIHIVHFILSRHFEYGRDLCLELMQESAVNAAHQSKGNIVSVLAPERTAIAVQAILLSLHGYERDVMTPTWPSSTDFHSTNPTDDYPSSSDFLPPSLLAKSGIQDLVDRCGLLLATIVRTCMNTVGRMSMFDDQWLLSKQNVAYEETQNYVLRKHPEVGTLAYPSSLVPQVNLLQIAFMSWPRCLHSSLPTGEAIDMLLHGIVHVEPAVSDIARVALKRFLADATNSALVVGQFTQFLFSPAWLQEGSGTKLLFEASNLLDLWVNSVDVWIRSLIQQSPETLAEQEEVILQKCLDIEASGLFLLSHETRSIHMAGLKVIRTLGLLINHISPEPSTPAIGPSTPLVFVELLHGRGSSDSPYLQGYDELLEKPELSRLEQWRQTKRADTALRIADSNNEKDRVIWNHLYPFFMQSCMRYSSRNLSHFRDILVAAASRYHSTISQLAGLSTRIAVGRSVPSFERDGWKLVEANHSLIDQWHMWVKILCATATLPESVRPVLTSLGRDHSRAPSDTSFERERLTTSRGLFRFLTPFLDSEYTPFRDAAVLCISSLPPDAYPQLLEDLSLLAGRQFYDDPRTKLAIGIMNPVETNLGVLAARQGGDEARKGNNIVGERMRRQERLHSAVARIYYLTSRHLDNQRSAGRQATLANVLKFVRNTQSFLTSPEMRDNYSLQRLRRYFCGTIERLFDNLLTLKDFDRFIPANMHLTLYRLCEEWCQFGPQTDRVRQRQLSMEKAVGAVAVPPERASEAIERFREESLMLSYAAVGALSILCQKAFSPPGVDSGSPTDRHSSDHLKPLTTSQVLERLTAILTSAHLPAQQHGKKALKSLLLLNTGDMELQDEALRRAIVTTDESDTSHGRFFEVISETVCSTSAHGFSFAQVVCLALSNLCHPVLATRRQAFDILEAIHSQQSGLLTMSQFEATVGSSASGTYVHSHRLVSDFLAEEHPDQAMAMLAQLSRWLPGLQSTPSFDMVIVLLLQSLEFWISNIQLMTEDKVSLSREGHLALYQLMTLTLRYGQSHPEQILILWNRLVEPPNQSNGHATVRFLLEQSHKVGSTVFIDSAANIVACICQAVTGQQIFEDICSVIEPVRMLPTLEHRLNFPDAHDLELWSDLDALFVDGRPRMSLGAAQFAWLFLADVTLSRYWEVKDQLPVLLHSVFTHLDNRTSFIRLRARRMLFQLLRSWTPGYDELPDRVNYPSRQMLKTAIVDLEREAEDLFWKEEEKGSEVEPKMRTLSSRVIQLLEPLCPSLRERWGTLALEWGTACSIRSTAFRSLQIFRALLPRVKTQQLALLIGRLSNTISAPDDGVKAFTSEIILTLNSVISSDSFDMTLLPQFFWCTCASLSTAVEHEFAEVLKLLQTLLTRINFDDPVIVDQLLSHRPHEWNGTDSLQSTLLKGLRSSVTSEETLKVLQILVRYSDGRLIDAEEGRVRDLYTLSLPWCLHSMSGERGDDSSLKEFAENISLLAKREGRISIHKIMTSFSKGHFRTKDDFLRQSVSSLREHYGTQYWTEIVTLLMGLVLNKERWLRIQTMQILQVLFQQRETRNPVDLLGSELLTPLLRLLESDLASQALDVLEEPMTMSGGLAAKHVLRMSMHTRTVTLPTPKEVDSAATVFGVPEESGWCVVKADELRATCRANLVGVFDTCSMPTRPSRIEFQPEEMEFLASSSPVEEDLGGLVQNLHDLTTFFQDEKTPKPATLSTVPNRRLEARVAAILAKSTAPDIVQDVPPTPFVDVFRVGDDSSDEDSDDYSINSDSELDAFYFDSPTIYRSAPNGSRIS